MDRDIVVLVDGNRNYYGVPRGTVEACRFTPESKDSLDEISEVAGFTASAQDAFTVVGILPYVPTTAGELDGLEGGSPDDVGGFMIMPIRLFDGTDGGTKQTYLSTATSKGSDDGGRD